jgi:hypothetical protein
MPAFELHEAAAVPARLAFGGAVFLLLVGARAVLIRTLWMLI